MMADIFQQLLGPRPSLTIDIEQGFVTGLWVAGRRPDLIIRDFDLGASTPDAAARRLRRAIRGCQLAPAALAARTRARPSAPVSILRITPCHNAAPAFGALPEPASRLGNRPLQCAAGAQGRGRKPVRRPAPGCQNRAEVFL